MSIRTKLRSYREKNDHFAEHEEFIVEHSGYFFHSNEERNQFLDEDDFFSQEGEWRDDSNTYFTDTSV